LDTRVTSTQGISSQEWIFPNLKIFLPILDELEELDFGEIGRNPPNRRDKSHGFTSRLEVDDKTHPSAQIHRRNQRITPQITKSKIGLKMPPKITKMENITAQDMR
jgi:hypothetical protein